MIHTVGYEDQGRVRPILYRAALSDMVVPYGDPGKDHYRKNAFDAGEYGIGSLTNSLTLGCDCLGEIYYFDAVLNNGQGEPFTIPNAVCMHEEDYGILWKHTDWRSGADRGATLAAAGDFQRGHGGQLRVRFLLVLLPGRHDTDGGQADRYHQHRRHRRGRDAEVRHHRRAATQRAHPPALLQLPHGHERGRRGKLGVRGEHRGRAAGSGQPAQQCLLRAEDTCWARSTRRSG